MKKSIFCVPIALALTLGLASCGGGEAAPSQAAQATASPAAESAPAAPEGYVFRAGDCTISMGQDMADVLSALGEPHSYFEAASCAFEGLDKTYTWSGFSVTTRPDGDKDYVNDVLLTDDSVTTPEGLYIGASRSDITAVYGEGETQGAALNYTQSGVTLSFILDGDTVISIEYLPA